MRQLIACNAPLLYCAVILFLQGKNSLKGDVFPGGFELFFYLQMVPFY